MEIMMKMNNKRNHPLFYRWKSIMDRCYRPNVTNYKYYGGSGVTVSERWHEFWSFVYDVDNHLKNGHLLYETGKTWHLDKDLKGGMIYSLENCVVMSAEENRKMANDKLSRKIVATKDGKENVFESISEAGRQLNIKRTNVRCFLRSGNPDKITGYGFKYYD